ncbi:hypothetical protein AB3S75_040245 [Citrus x aurantiifolia]
MALYEHPDALMCRIFPSSLDSSALNWYHNLPSSSIHSFAEICSAFITQYSTYRDMKKGSDYLFTVQIGHAETLKDYIRRFRLESAKVENCDDQLAIVAFKRGLPSNHTLFESLVKNKPNCMWDLLIRAQKYVTLEEEKKSLASKFNKTNNREQRFSENRWTDSLSQMKKEEKDQSKKYTLLKIPIGQILHQIKDEPWLKRPAPMAKNQNRDIAKYCAFYKD